MPILNRFLTQTRANVTATSRFLKKSSLLSLSALSQNQLPYRAVGLVNKPFGIIKSIFVVYPAETKYLQHLCFDSMKDIVKWNPSPIGIFKQGKHWGLVIALPASEDDFLSGSNRESLIKVLNKLEKMKTHLGAEQINLAGILPSYLERIELLPSADANSEKAAKVVMRAIQLLIAEQGHAMDIILLGGAGHVGSHLTALLRNQLNIEAHIVDPKIGITTLPRHIKNKPAILVDTSRRGALAKYVDQFWPELVLLNETYPEPSPKILNKLRENFGTKAFHVGGVEGKIYPSLPFAYEGCVPCCGIHDDTNLAPVIKAL